MSDTNLLGDRYELGDVLGRGGMAEVRYGRDRRLGRAVAIKMLRVDHATDPTFQERFRREAQSAASLNHRNIVAVYDTGEDFFDGSSIPYIVMEYVEGRTLRDLLQERIRFTPERSSEVIAGVLDALDYSHRAGIVHRDIKPGNVMINNAGEVKVMDFGIARSLAETGAALTQTAAVVGTAQYISPEQARGESADARSDLYAVGCVLYELLTGRPPFVGESLVSVAVSHVREMATPPSALDPSIPQDVDSVVLKSLAKDRRERYQSAYEMRTDLERVAAGMPVAAQSTSATQFIGGGAGGYGDTAMYQPQSAPGGYDDGYDDYDDGYDDDDRGGMSWGALVGAGVAILLAAGLIGYLIFRGGGEPEAQAFSAPDLLGLSVEEANAHEDLLANNVTVVEVDQQVTQDEGDWGKIIAQEPAQLTMIDPGSTIDVVVGTGPDQATVPNLEGANRNEVADILDEAGLSVGREDTDETDDEELWDTVKSQSIDPNEQVEQGTVVDIVYWTEPGSVRVPSVRGMTRDEARDTLVDPPFNLTVVGEEEEPSDEIEEGRVIRTEPGGGEEVEPGSEVTLILSSGEEAIVVPDFMSSGDYTVPSATAELSALGLTLTEGPDDTENCDGDNGIIVGQLPPPGTEVEAGSSVTVNVRQCTDDEEPDPEPEPDE